MKKKILKNTIRFYKLLFFIMGIIGIISISSCVFRGHKAKYGGPPAEYSNKIDANTQQENEKNI
ncbi:MAG: hypothetical protein ABIJ97_09735 [Bacteroidota bacterium]